MNDQEYNRLTHDEIIERLPAFVVGALDPDEMLAVEDYLQAHPELVARVQELELAAAKLAYAAPPQPLPSDLHAKIMNRAMNTLPTQQTPAARAAAPVPRQTAQSSAPQRRAAQPLREESWFAAWWRSRGLWDLAMGGAVSAALLLAVLYGNALLDVNSLRRQMQNLEQRVALVQEQNNALQNENVRLQNEINLQQNQLASITGAQYTVALGGTEAAPGASGRLYVHNTTGTLVLNNLDQLSESQVYQLWLIPPDGAPIPAGLLGHSAAGTQTLTLQLPTTLDSVAAVGISVEPPGGSAAPTGPIVLLGEKA